MYGMCSIWHISIHHLQCITYFYMGQSPPFLPPPPPPPQIVRNQHARLVEQSQTNLQREAALNDVRNQIAVIRSADSGSVAQFNARRARVQEMIAPVAPNVLISTLQVCTVCAGLYGILYMYCWCAPLCECPRLPSPPHRLLHSKQRQRVSKWCASLSRGNCQWMTLWHSMVTCARCITSVT